MLLTLIGLRQKTFTHYSKKHSISFTGSSTRLNISILQPSCEYQRKHSCWRNQRNSFPQGNIQAPLVFSIYINDQSMFPYSRCFIYRDDLALTVHREILSPSSTSLPLKYISLYYKNCQLNPNPLKAQVCTFHLRKTE